ncbi:phage tail protein [Lacrimispora saccharolytica]|nr:phage tail protein [Lacrimispora saccharolytica]
MYKIYANDTAIWTPNDNEKKFVSPKLALEVNKLGSLSFTIYPNHKAYDLLVKMQTIISVYQDNEILFKGRIFSDKADFRKAKKVEIEGILGYFNDSIVRPYSFTGDVPDYLEMLINQHNNQMPGQKQFKLGNVTVTDPNNYITRSSSDYPKTWEEIENKLIKLLGGYIVIRYEEDGNYIDYLADFPTEETQKIEYAVNLLDLDNEVKADNLATCIIPLGASVQDDEGNSSRITIKDVNNGLDYIYDPIVEAVYGRISKTVTWDDVTLPENLLKKAQEWIKTAALLEGTLTIKAVDLHLIDDQIQAFRIGQYIPVYSVPHGINEDLLLTKFDLDLSNPANFTFSLGRTKTSFVNLQFTNNTDSKKVLRSAEQISQEVNQIRNEVGNKVDSNVGVGNTGKYLGIDALGNVVPVDPPAEFDIHSLNTKATIAENDEFPIYGPNVTENRKLLWSTIKSVLKSYFDQIYDAINHKHTISDIEDFPDLENTYAKKDHNHTVSDIEDFPKINHYQGEEIVVGSWFSEPLYRSVIQITDLETEAGSFNRPHNIIDISLITRVEGILVSNGSTQYLSNVSADKTDIFYTLDTVTESGIGYLVIEYTKLSGEEGSENDGV